MNLNPSYQPSFKDGPVYESPYELVNQPVEDRNHRTRSIVSVQKSVNRKLRLSLLLDLYHSNNTDKGNGKLQTA